MPTVIRFRLFSGNCLYIELFYQQPRSICLYHSQSNVPIEYKHLPFIDAVPMPCALVPLLSSPLPTSSILCFCCSSILTADTDQTSNVHGYFSTHSAVSCWFSMATTAMMHSLRRCGLEKQCVSANRVCFDVAPSSHTKKLCSNQ